METTGPANRRPAEPDSGETERILAQIESLPTLPAVVDRLSADTADERAGAADLVEAVESDPSMSARLLSLARRSPGGASADGVERAVALLGIRAVRAIVLADLVVETLAQRVETATRRFDRAEFWRHSLAVGCAAHLLTRSAYRLADLMATGSIEAEEAFLCGLLHDLGKAALAACFPRTYDRVVERADTLLVGIVEAERESFGLDHTVAGRRLASRWKLPTMVVEAVWLHHHLPAAIPTRIRHGPCVRLVRLADEIVRHLRIGYSGNHEAGHLVSEWRSIAGGEAVMDRFREELLPLIEKRAERLGLELGPGLGPIRTAAAPVEAIGRSDPEMARLSARLAEAERQSAQRSALFDALETLKDAMGDEPTHERVCEAAVRSARRLLTDEALAVVAYSPSRRIALLAAAGPGSSDVHREAIGVAENGGCGLPAMPLGRWSSPERWPAGVRDRLVAATGREPTFGLPVGRPPGCTGAMVLDRAPTKRQKEVVGVLADWVGRWLAAAEARTTAERLTEEWSEMNRRLVDSRTELARIRSLAMVGEMAAGAAHELNNPLAVISGRAQLLARGGADEEVRRAAELIVDHAHRASAIVTELMAFAKPAAPAPTAWPIGPLLADLRTQWLAKSSWRDDQFTITLSDDLPSVWADADQVRTLFDEVIRNAIEAMSHRDDPRLNVNCLLDVADEKVVVRVEDNGVGMTAEVLDRAVAPFFSHRPAGRGRGLGLSRALRYAEINGGRLRLASRPTEGTVVLVSLPVAKESPAPAGDAGDQRPDGSR